MLVVTLGTPFAAFGLSMMGRRPALHQLAPSERLSTIGFMQVFRTLATLRTKYPNLCIFFLGYTFWESATGAVTTITGEYVIEQLAQAVSVSWKVTTSEP